MVPQKFEVLFNHFAELVVRWAYFAPMPISAVAGLITLFFHGWLFASGNFAFLGFLTMVLALSTIGDSWLKHVVRMQPPALAPPGRVRSSVILALGIAVGVLSFYPIMNMLSPHREMNASLDNEEFRSALGAITGAQ